MPPMESDTLGSKGQETTVGLKRVYCFCERIFNYNAPLVAREIPMPAVFYPLAKWSLVVNEQINSKDSLDFLHTTLAENPTIVIELSAHTDSRG